MAKSDSGSGNWLMTYADFITLMMIFFIVLYTLTPGVEKNKWESITAPFKGKDGVLDFNSVVQSEAPQSAEWERAMNWDFLYQKIQDENLQESLEIHLIPEGILIVLGEASLFETYSVNLMPDAFPLLEEVVKGINNYTFEEVDIIDIQGHTDNRPVVTNSFQKYESNWELGSGRALSVMEFLKDHTTLGGEYYSISSFGEHRPVAPNDSPENMRKNRRVEVFIQYRGHEPEDAEVNETDRGSETDPYRNDNINSNRNSPLNIWEGKRNE
ncbi:MAG: flagellar motor protein MotB [Balneolaceae bacterium]